MHHNLLSELCQRNVVLRDDRIKSLIERYKSAVRLHCPLDVRLQIKCVRVPHSLRGSLAKRIESIAFDGRNRFGPIMLPLIDRFYGILHPVHQG